MLKRKVLRITGFMALFFMLSATLLSGCGSTDTLESTEVSIYADSENWAYLETDIVGMDADVFFICPTVYSGSDDSYNMSLDDTETEESFLGTVNMEKGIYDDDARFFAPYYSQAGLNVYTLDTKKQEEYLQIAFEDVCEAFEYYLEYYNDDNPIVLAGFSQGADMCIRLLKEYFYDDELSEKLIACYAIGWRITQEEIDEYPYLEVAEGETDTGVIISFNSESEDITDSLMVPEGTTTLAINPLNWKTDGTAADKSLNMGACFTDYSGEIVTEIDELTGAYIDSERGTLKVTDVNSEDYPAVLDIFEDGIYHLYDYQFFYRNLELNVQLRIETYLNENE